jgi:hypothetical protein
MKLAYILYEDMTDGCDRVKAVFDHDPSEQEILNVIDDSDYRVDFYVSEIRLITIDN